ncbi:MAG: hypothetical protein CSA97_02820 [Bacteroidetes bacterium]|nr:MAG: hypothetical protein CSA97_02820 [Bacteroidota bacterium]
MRNIYQNLTCPRPSARSFFLLLMPILLSLMSACGSVGQPQGKFPADGTSADSNTLERADPEGVAEQTNSIEDDMEDEGLYEEFYALLRKDELDLPARQRVYVDDLASFFSELRNDRELILTMDTLNLSDASIRPYLSDTDEGDGQGRILWENSNLVLDGFRNLSITSAKTTQLVVDNDYQHVLCFRNSTDVQLSNLNLFHRVSTACDADVLVLLQSKRIAVKACELNGSGVVGLRLKNAQRVRVEGSQFYSNSGHAILAEDSRDIELNECRVYENPSTELIRLSNSDCRLVQTSFTDNEATSFYNATTYGEPTELMISGCTFSGNRFTSPPSDQELRAMDGKPLQVSWTEEGMVREFLRVDASLEPYRLELWLGDDVYTYFDWWERSKGASDQATDQATFLMFYAERADQLLRVRNDVLDVWAGTSDPPEALLVQSFTTLNEPDLIRRVEYKIRLQWAEGGSETTENPYEHAKILGLEVLKRRELPSLNLSLSEVEGLDDVDIAHTLKDFRRRTQLALREAYYLGLSYGEANCLELALRQQQQDALVAYRQSGESVSDRDHGKIVEYIMDWHEKTLALLGAWDVPGVKR